MAFRIRAVIGLVLVAFALGVSPGAVPLASADAGAVRIYEVTLTNLTTSQPLSPPLLAVHSKNVDVFSVGETASAGVRLIAEDGDNGLLAAALGVDPGVHDVLATALPIRRIGGGGPPGSSTSMTVMVEARGNARYLSIVTMLICTNDGFTGLDAITLPGGFNEATYLAGAYDAGTEQNNEASTQIVDPCGAIGPAPLPADGNGRVATAGVIAMHPGITGIGDLSAAHAWSNPVLQITVQRVK